MREASRLAAAAAFIGFVLVAASPDVRSQQPLGAVSVSAGYATGVDELRRWDVTVDRMTRTGELVVLSRLADRSLPGREHEYAAQFFGDIPVYGGGVARQLDRGVTVSLFGTLHEGLDIDTSPALSAGDVLTRIEEQTGVGRATGPPPRLVILPLPDGSYALTYRAEMRDARIYFADATDGAIVHAVDAFDSQTAIGIGTGFRGDRKKVVATQATGRFEARDQLRPGELVTLDMDFDGERLAALLERGEFGVRRWTASDVADDDDNDWDDPAVVDLQAHMGWTYDYFALRHGWNGVNGNNRRVFGLVNNAVQNAYAYHGWTGPEGTGAYVFGQRGSEPRVALHTVAHELMHGITYHSVGQRTMGARWGIWTNFDIGARLGPRSITYEGREHACEDTSFPIRIQGEWRPVPAWCLDGRFILASYQGSAVNEAYSDIFGVSVGFFHEEAGATGSYVYGADYAAGPIRSLEDPRSLGTPDSYGLRYEFALARGDRRWYFSGALFEGGRLAAWRQGYCCYGAHHWNSPILSHAFYLAIEGGTNRSTGLSVEGVGGANRAQMERIFFRAMAELMPQATSLPQAADAVRQAAADLAAGDPAQRAVEEALRAVGLPPGTLTE